MILNICHNCFQSDIEYLPQLSQSTLSVTDKNRKNKDQNSNKRFALFTWSSSFFVTAKEYNQVQVGVHETGSGEQDVPPLKHWEQRWEAEKMPRRLPRVGIEMEIIPDFLHQALKLLRGRFG